MKLLLADLVVFDLTRCDWRYAAATVLGLFLPLVLARLLAMPALSWVGIGAFLLAIGHAADEEEHWRSLRGGVASLLGGVALATGVLAGNHLSSAVAGMLFWGVLTGLIGVYGNSLAALGLPVAWAYVELGLPQDDHAPAYAVELGLLFALGGLLAFLITSLVGRKSYSKRLRLRTAACYRSLGTYLDALGSRPCGPERDPISPEMRVRLNIGDARGVATRLYVEQPGMSRKRQSYLVLIELADRIFSLAAVLHEMPEVKHLAGKPSLTLIEKAVHAVVDALTGKPNTAALRSLLTELEAARDATVGPSMIALDIDKRIMVELIRALSVIADDRVPPLVPLAPVASPKLPSMEPLIGCFRPDSIVGRHALRFGVVSSAAVVLFWIFPPPFGYWIPLTATAVLKPYAGLTYARSVQRVVGTIAGILVGMALMVFVASLWANALLVAVAFFFMMAVLPFNYSLAIFFLSLGIVPYEHLLTPGLDENVGAYRLVATGIGATVALVGGHLLWPTFERDSLPAMMRTALCSMSRFAKAVLRPGDADEAGSLDLRRQAGFDMTNLQAALHDALRNGGSPEPMQAATRAVTALQRLFLTMNAVMNAAVETTSGFTSASSVREDLVAAISQLADLSARASRPEDAAQKLPFAVVSGSQSKPTSATFLDRELDRALSEVTMLKYALHGMANAACT